ncbi:MAG: RluA family pseudouridine synthase [Chloroflexi bacterium]|nr:RluA family pseudouridine synthase [Chloroflexota bacterium]
MSQTLSLVCDAPGERVDSYVARQRADLSRSQVQRLAHDGLLRVNGRPARASIRLKAGDLVELLVPEPPANLAMAEPMPLQVVYQDPDVVVIDKPPGLTVHPAPGHPRGTLVNALLARYPELRGVGDATRPGLVHRLDADTSGLLVVARTEAARLNLARQIEKHSVRKVYLALVRGYPDPPEGLIEAPVGRDPKNRKRMAVVPGGRSATTEYRRLQRFRGFTLLEVVPRTGRTHQIRVHLASLGHPVAGDKVYGGRVPFLDRQFLHAYRLGFRLPRSGEYVEFTSPLPEELEEVLGALSEAVTLLEAPDR